MADNPNSWYSKEEDLEYIRVWTEREIQKLAPSFVTHHLKAEIVEKGNKVSFLFRIDLAKISDGDPAKSARAFEYGSGIHAQRNLKSKNQLSVKGKILIVPVKKKLLAFNWERADRDGLVETRIGQFQRGEQPSFAKFSNTDNRLLFNYVHHPGVEAANGGLGYMREGLRRAIPRITQTISTSAVENLKVKVRAAFSRPGGKNK